MSGQYYIKFRFRVLYQQDKVWVETSSVTQVNSLAAVIYMLETARGAEAKECW